MDKMVSVLMATYNGEKYLKEQLDSIIFQTYENLEIIIQDDCSSDGTCEILKAYASRDSRIKLYFNDKNLGINENFFDLIKKAQGDYIAISDQDDIWELTKIEILVNNIGEYSLIYTDSKLIDANNHSLGSTLLESINATPVYGKHLFDLFIQNVISGHACLFNQSHIKSMLSSTKEKAYLNYVYDQIIGVIASVHNGVTYYNEPMTNHRIHGENSANHSIVSSKKNDYIKDSIDSLKDARVDFTHLEKNPKKPKRFLKRKRFRIQSKCSVALTSLKFLEHCFNEICPHRSPFHPRNKDSEKFNYCFMNISLFVRLLKNEFEFKRALKLSFGKYYYFLFKFL